MTSQTAAHPSVTSDLQKSSSLTISLSSDKTRSQPRVSHRNQARCPPISPEDQLSPSFHLVCGAAADPRLLEYLHDPNIWVRPFVKQILLLSLPHAFHQCDDGFPTGAHLCHSLQVSNPCDSWITKLIRSQRLCWTLAGHSHVEPSQDSTPSLPPTSLFPRGYG